MKNFIEAAQYAFAALGGAVGAVMGGFDGFLYALIVFVVVDYLTGVMAAVLNKKLSSEVGFKGICRKVLIFLLVGIANILDVQVIRTGGGGAYRGCLCHSKRERHPYGGDFLLFIQ